MISQRRYPLLRRDSAGAVPPHGCAASRRLATSTSLPYGQDLACPRHEATSPRRTHDLALRPWTCRGVSHSPGQKHAHPTWAPVRVGWRPNGSRLERAYAIRPYMPEPARWRCVETAFIHAGASPHGEDRPGPVRTKGVDAGSFGCVRPSQIGGVASRRGQRQRYLYEGVGGGGR